ncbi:poly(R)-hydroxyalkanoic acid synthase, class III, PhaC subunit [Magnetococcus marinus MC-1]|uniref:Poly(3-hydroxyalkanoate) polymerase subunit PhaC n=1 Tax=Magnetococcus marinus (strain ATCC BAA-1437 / JCM 17883 / MC-1) TaxID=156889 RepID=A0L6T8_MAGMM|nr:class III poly(R)-hydroxyalkanoic acid synthase subunit PhaC [Magnetococcus marinus]ABK43681.1 poly(R)-hydroxyalkanoic acid synthase, class III, PhaC subunit [Magnetococcus marinus MC-1]
MFPLQLTPQSIAQELADFNKNLAEGYKNLAELGPIEVGTSDKEVVYREDKMVLYRFTPQVKKPHAVPMLIVYALVNRPYMTDLQEDRSTIRGLLEEGMDVYLIDWGYPDAADRYLGLEDYVDGYIKRSVNHICRSHDLDAINLLGICQGGAFSLCFAALYPEKVKNLVTMVTPVDFQTPDNMLSLWARHLDVDLLVETMGNVPGELLNFTFLSMKPFSLTGQKYLDLVEIMQDKTKLCNFMRMEKWIFDSPDQAGEAFRQFIKMFYQENGLVNGTAQIGGKEVKLENITMPILNIYATLDHLVPPAASKVLKGLVGSTDYTELPFKGGHIGIYVSGRAQREVPPSIANWLKAR